MDERLRQLILDNIDRQEVIDLESALIEIPSYTTEETELARFIADHMQNFGLEAQLQEVSLGGGGTSHNVIGRLPGSGDGPTLLFFGHLDHEPTLGRHYENLEGWKREPFKPSVEGEWIYGKGCQDEKGGLCSFITAAKVLRRVNFKPKGDIYFCPVQGHKRVSSGILHMLEAGIRSDYAINSENTGNAIVPLWVGRAEGSVHIRVDVPELHFHFLEQVPELKSRKTAFEQLTQLLLALGPEMDSPGPDSWMTYSVTPGLTDYPQIRVEMIKFHNLNHLEVSFQIRTVPGQTDDLIRSDLRRLIHRVRESDTQFNPEILWPSWPSRPAANLPHSHPLVQRIARAHEFVSGNTPEIGPRARLGAACDASHVVGHLKIPTVLYGPGGGLSDLNHFRRVMNREIEADERIRIDDIVVAAKVYALAAAELCG